MSKTAASLVNRSVCGTVDRRGRRTRSSTQIGPSAVSAGWRGDVPIRRLDAVREALPRADVAVSVSQFAASILLPGVAIPRALLFGRWPLSIFCWTSNLLHMALGLPINSEGGLLDSVCVSSSHNRFSWRVSSPAHSPPSRTSSKVQSRTRTRMTGYIHPMAKAENDLGPLDVSVPLPAITLVLSQTPEQQADLDGFLTAQQDPSSPDYHRWLSPEQYADRFGASPDDIAKITAWLEQHNLHVT